jgi:hypothetical protein
VHRGDDVDGIEDELSDVRHKRADFFRWVLLGLTLNTGVFVAGYVNDSPADCLFADNSLELEEGGRVKVNVRPFLDEALLVSRFIEDAAAGLVCICIISHTFFFLCLLTVLTALERRVRRACLHGCGGGLCQSSTGSYRPYGSILQAAVLPHVVQGRSGGYPFLAACPSLTSCTA